MATYNIGDIVKLKKPHPCGNYEWIIKRTGADFRIKCTSCQHEIMLSRPNFEKQVKEYVLHVKTAPNTNSQ